MDNLENNKLIAEFMGATIQEPYDSLEGLSGLMFYYPKDSSPALYRNLPLSAIKYDSDWRWLMSVVEKISDIDNQADIELAAEFDRVTPQLIRGGTSILCDKAGVYRRVVEFIKIYNNYMQS